MLLYLLCTHGLGLILALLIAILFERFGVTKRVWFVLYKWYFILVMPIIWFSCRDIRESVNNLVRCAE